MSDKSISEICTTIFLLALIGAGLYIWTLSH
jgi:hypothetical protein